MIFNKYLKYFPLFGIFVIALCVGFLSVKADKNFILYKVKGIAQNNYEYTATITNAGNKYVREYVSNFPYTQFFIDFNGTIRNYLHQKNMNNVIKLNNGNLVRLNRKLTEKELDIRADRLKNMNYVCKKNNIDFLLLMPSYDISKYDPQLPIGYSDYTNQNIDGLLERIKQDVSFIDLREEMYRDGLNVYDYYYRTDHHWNLRGGFYAFKKIVKWISEKRNYPYDPLTTDINNYEIKLYPQWHTGSMAQRTGVKFAGQADDYELFVPKFPTRILNIKDKTVKSIYDSLVNDSIFKTRPKKTDRSTYDSAYNKNNINELENLDAKTPLSILFIGDSYSFGVKQFMLLTYKHFYFEWQNYNIIELIKKYSPDVVIVETYPMNLMSESIYKF